MGVGAIAGGLLLPGGCSGSGEKPNDAGVDADLSPDTRDDYLLYSSGRIGNLELKNRLVRSATEECLTPAGEVTDDYLELYRNLAAGGIGLIISGMMPPWEPDAFPLQVYLFDDRYIEGLGRVSQAVHRADSQCKLVAQICHSGQRIVGPTRVGPSDIEWPGDQKDMRALSVAEIEELIDAFAQAIRRTKEAGWDGAELHGAHAYLLSTFLSPYTNRRTDDYGGSVRKRVRIVLEIVESARALVGDFPILIKVNSDDSGGGHGNVDGINRENFGELARELENAGVDALEVSGNDCLSQEATVPAEQSYFLGNLEDVDVNIPIILTGGNRSVELLEEIMQAGQPDFIGLARPLVREPDLPNRWLNREGYPESRCISCNECFDSLIGGLRCHQPS